MVWYRFLKSQVAVKLSSYIYIKITYQCFLTIATLCPDPQEREIRNEGPQN